MGFKYSQKTIALFPVENKLTVVAPTRTIKSNIIFKDVSVP